MIPTEQTPAPTLTAPAKNRGDKCLGKRNREKTIARNIANTKHGHAKGTKGNTRCSRTYKSWDGMKQRCNNPNDDHYPNYGGRGIIVCDRWLGDNGFLNFITDMGERPEGMTMDRFPDNDGNYEPFNCRWATAQQQQNNKRPKGITRRNQEFNLTYRGRPTKRVMAAIQTLGERMAMHVA